MKKGKPILLLPSGKTTTSTLLYKKSWEGKVQPILRALEGELAAFDPGYLIWLPKEGKMIRLDADVVLKLGKALSGKKLRLGPIGEDGF